MNGSDLTRAFLSRLGKYWWSFLLLVLFAAYAFALARSRAGAVAATTPAGEIPVLDVLGFQGVMALLAPVFACQVFMPDVSSRSLCQLLAGPACREAFFVTAFVFSLVISIAFAILGTLASMAAIALDFGLAGIGGFDGVLPWAAQAVLCSLTCSALAMLAGVASRRAGAAYVMVIALWSGIVSSYVIGSGWFADGQLCWVPAQYMLALSQGVVTQPLATAGLVILCVAACVGGVLTMRFRPLD